MKIIVQDGTIKTESGPAGNFTAEIVKGTKRFFLYLSGKNVNWAYNAYDFTEGDKSKRYGFLISEPGNETFNGIELPEGFAGKEYEIVFFFEPWQRDVPVAMTIKFEDGALEEYRSGNATIQAKMEKITDGLALSLECQDAPGLPEKAVLVYNEHGIPLHMAKLEESRTVLYFHSHAERGMAILRFVGLDEFEEEVRTYNWDEERHQSVQEPIRIPEELTLEAVTGKVLRDHPKPGMEYILQGPTEAFLQQEHTAGYEFKHNDLGFMDAGGRIEVIGNAPYIIVVRYHTDRPPKKYMFPDNTILMITWYTWDDKQIPF